MEPIGPAGQSHLSHTCPVYSSGFRACKCPSTLTVWFRPSTKAQQHNRQHFSRWLLEDEIKAMSKGILPEDGSTLLFLKKDKRRAWASWRNTVKQTLWAALHSKRGGEFSNLSVVLASNWYHSSVLFKSVAWCWHLKRIQSEDKTRLVEIHCRSNPLFITQSCASWFSALFPVEVMSLCYRVNSLWSHWI